MVVAGGQDGPSLTLSPGPRVILLVLRQCYCCFQGGRPVAARTDPASPSAAEVEPRRSSQPQTLEPPLMGAPGDPAGHASGPCRTFKQAGLPLSSLPAQTTAGEGTLPTGLGATRTSLRILQHLKERLNVIPHSDENAERDLSGRSSMRRGPVHNAQNTNINRDT